MRYRVEDLAQTADTSVDTIRYYQSMGLLDAPEREGRAAWYDDDHVRTLARIKDLKTQGFTLAMVKRALSGELDAGEEALAAAIVRLPQHSDQPAPAGPTGPMDLAALSSHTGVSVTVLESVARQGILIPSPDEDLPYSAADAEAVRAGQALLDAGVPISELLALAREHDAAIGAVADQAVDLFARFVRDPIRARTDDEDEAAQQMVEALQTMLPAATSIISHAFQRRLLATARERLEADAKAEDPVGAAGADAG